MISAVLDACVLIPSVLADTLLRCAEDERYRPLWSAEILAEVRRNLPASVDTAAAAMRIAAMRSSFPEAEVDGYRALVGQMIIHQQAAATGRYGHAKFTFEDILDGLAGCNVTRFAHRVGEIR